MNGNGEKEKRERGTGRMYQRGNRWWIEYWHRGRQFRESAGATDAEARKRLKARLKEIAGDRFVGPKEERLSVAEVCDNLILHLETRGAKSLKSFRHHLKPVKDCFSLTRAVDLTTAAVEKFMQARLAAGKAPATVNRETGALKQALNLARKQGRLTRSAYLPMLREDNVRQGFFERAEFEAVAKQLPAPLDDLARFAYLTGWRKGEIQPLRWESVDMGTPEVRLRTSKNGRGRVLPLVGELLDLMKKRKAARQLTRADGTVGVSDYVFHRRGKPVRDFARAWATACREAGVPGKHFHDFRRTAARDMVRAGVPETVAMQITGHKTRSMFDRYNITSADDVREAIRKTKEYRDSLPTGRNVVAIRS